MKLREIQSQHPVFEQQSEPGAQQVLQQVTVLAAVPGRLAVAARAADDIVSTRTAIPTIIFIKISLYDAEF
jgi:hypothetical protein